MVDIVCPPLLFNQFINFASIVYYTYSFVQVFL